MSRVTNFEGTRYADAVLNCGSQGRPYARSATVRALGHPRSHVDIGAHDVHDLVCLPAGSGKTASHRVGLPGMAKEPIEIIHPWFSRNSAQSFRVGHSPSLPGSSPQAIS